MTFQDFSPMIETESLNLKKVLIVLPDLYRAFAIEMKFKD